MSDQPTRVGAIDSQGRGLRLRAGLDIVASIVMISAAVVLTWNSLTTNTASPQATTIPVPATPISLQGAQVMGERDARITLAMFSDYECPFCSRFENQIFPEIKRDFVDKGLVNVAFWNFPLDIHPMAVRAAEAVECAGVQGKFWPMHYRLFADPKKLEMADLLAAADSAGVAKVALAECLRENRMLAGVKSDKAVGEALGINSTPAFLIGTVRGDSLIVSATVKGAKPYGAFKASLEKALAEAR